MLFYVFVFGFCVFTLALNNRIFEKQKKILEITTLLFLGVISGTRYYLGGTDYYVYKTVFDSLPNVFGYLANFDFIHDTYMTFGFERGYLFYNSVVKTLGFNFFGFTLINSTIFYSCFYKAFKRYSVNMNLLIIVFLYKMFFYNTFISMRQSVTIAIFFLSLKYLEEKKMIPYFMLCMVAITFHTAAVVLFPVYLVSYFKLTKKSLLILNAIFIPTIALSFLNLPFLKMFDSVIGLINNPTTYHKAQSLVEGEPISQLSLFHTMEYFLIMVLVIVYFRKIISLNEHAEFVIKLFILLLPLFTLLRNYEILTRLKDYFVLSYGLILGYLTIMDNRRINLILQVLTISICGFGFFRFIILFDYGAMIPYESFLLKGIGILG